MAEASSRYSITHALEAPLRVDLGARLTASETAAKGGLKTAPDDAGPPVLGDGPVTARNHQDGVWAQADASRPLTQINPPPTAGPVAPDDGDLIDLSEDNVLFGGEGADTISGYAGDDTLHGAGGNDSLFGGDDNDILYGEDGNDMLIGGHGDDVVDGGAGNDYINAWDGNNTLLGGDGNDEIWGGVGIDTIQGGAGSDILDGHYGQDELWGGTGADHFSNSLDASIFDVVRDYSFAEGDTVEGHHYDVDAYGHTHIYDVNNAEVLVLTDYDAFSLGITLI